MIFRNLTERLDHHFSEFEHGGTRSTAVSQWVHTCESVEEQRIERAREVSVFEQASACLAGTGRSVSSCFVSRVSPFSA